MPTKENPIPKPEKKPKANMEMAEKMELAKKLLSDPLDIPPRMVTLMVFEPIMEGEETVSY